MAEGYESFFSCTRTTGQGRVGYSGVATFCRVKSAFSSNEAALPLAAEEGFTGLLENSRGFGTKIKERPAVVEGLEEFAKEELLKVDSEGRCIITDHGHFVLFNLYGPRVPTDDTERIQFKLTFFEILQKRWEFLLHQGRRIVVVGDLNIAPAAIDRCDAKPDFEKNEFRRWLRSMLVECGGPFFDTFRAKHPERREAYTCWPQNTGAEEFNYGSRIDHILISKSCLHQEYDMQDHSFLTCHVKECDILLQFQRWKPGISPRWKGGRSIKLDGSDHVPVCMTLMEIPDVQQHSTPSLSSRYAPMVHGVQQTIASVLMKRQVAGQAETNEASNIFSDELSENLKRTLRNCSAPGITLSDSFSSLDTDIEGSILRTDEDYEPTKNDMIASGRTGTGNEHIEVAIGTSTKKRPRRNQLSQLSLKSFFQKSSNLGVGVENSETDIALGQVDVSKFNHHSREPSTGNDDDSGSQSELNISALSHDPGEQDICGFSGNEKNNVALLEWRRIQQLMQNSIPLCKGHGETCVARVVKKAGPTCGRRFYACSRPEGPASNPETNCGYFKWAASKSRHK